MSFIITQHKFNKYNTTRDRRYTKTLEEVINTSEKDMSMFLTASREVFPTRDQHDIKNTSTDVVFVDKFHGVGTTYPDGLMPTHILTSGISSSNVPYPTSYMCRENLPRHFLCILLPMFRCVGNFFLYVFFKNI